ncbi:MAG: flavodoxin-dependent (E)-4-hydroxy-3-methylbut-2-enyl-diphosphate synthase [Candidatus Brocadiales bacterium]
MITRRKTRAVFAGCVQIGDGAPISVQSMTKTHTNDVAGTIRQIKELEEMGCQIIRAAVPTINDAKCLGEIKKAIRIPLVADIHFSARLALEAIAQGVDKIRINPGNIKDRAKVEQIVLAAKNKGVSIRIGVNSGSIRCNGNEKDELTDLMVKKTLEYCEHFESLGFKDMVLSLKASDVPRTIQAYRSVAKQCDYPLHLGITAAGPPSTATIKSAIGIGSLLSEGIGDTLRVSFTGSPMLEVECGYEILEALRLSKPREAELISCPTCGRCEIDLVKIVNEVGEKLPPRLKGLQIAIMGCVVNGPGEAKEVDIGVAGGKGFGLLFKKGREIRRIPESQMVSELLAEIEKQEVEKIGG